MVEYISILNLSSKEKSVSIMTDLQKLKAKYTKIEILSILKSTIIAIEWLQTWRVL